MAKLRIYKNDSSCNSLNASKFVVNFYKIFSQAV